MEVTGPGGDDGGLRTNRFGSVTSDGMPGIYEMQRMDDEYLVSFCIDHIPGAVAVQPVAVRVEHLVLDWLDPINGQLNGRSIVEFH